MRTNQEPAVIHTVEYVRYRLEKHEIPTRTSQESMLPVNAVISDDMKYCPMCGRNLTLDKFSKNKYTRLGVYAYCKECDKKNYERMAPEKNKREAMLRGIRKSQIIKKMGNKCAVCGAENLPVAAYTFHHTNPEEKEIDVSKGGYTSKQSLMEIENKCILVCFNCHMTLHYGDKTAEDYLLEENKGEK